MALCHLNGCSEVGVLKIVPFDHLDSLCAAWHCGNSDKIWLRCTHIVGVSMKGINGDCCD